MYANIFQRNNKVIYLNLKAIQSMIQSRPLIFCLTGLDNNNGGSDNQNNYDNNKYNSSSSEIFIVTSRDIKLHISYLFGISNG